MNSILKHIIIGIILSAILVQRGKAQSEFIGFSWDGNTITKVLDSTIFEVFEGLSRSMEKRIYEHNDLGFPIVYVSYYGLVGSKKDKRTFDYDERGNITVITGYEWDWEDSIWNPKFQNRYEYNNSSKVVWEGWGTWSRIEGVFSFKTRVEYDYNEEGNLISEMFYNSNCLDNCIEKSFDIYHYNARGLLDLKTSYSMYYDGTVVATDSATFAYNVQGQLVRYLQYRRPGEIDASKKVTYGYNDKGWVTHILHEEMSWNSEDWEFEKEEIFEYDERGNLIYGNGLKYYYDKTIPAKNIRILPEDIPYLGTDLVGSSSFRPRTKILNSFATNSYNSSYSYKNFYFSDWVTLNSTESTEEMSSLNVFPNPVKRYLNIRNNTGEPVDITIYDLAGRNIFEETVLEKRSLDLEGLKKGVYLYQIESSDSIKKGKIIKD